MTRPFTSLARIIMIIITIIIIIIMIIIIIIIIITFFSVVKSHYKDYNANGSSTGVL